MSEPKDGKQAGTMETSANESVNETFTFESVIVKEEPVDDQIFVTEDPEDMRFFESCIDIEEHPVKLEMEEEETDTLICGLPAPDTESSDQEQPQKIGQSSNPVPSRTKIGTNRLNFPAIPELGSEGPSKSTNKREAKPKPVKEPIPCGKCSQAFSSKRSLTQHQRTKHSQKLTCKICGVYFFAPSKFKLHQATHAKATKFECDTCHAKHGSAEGLRRHKKYLCRGNISKTSKIFETKFPCKLCFKSFDLYKNLYSHVRGVHSEKKHCCEVCGKRFTINSELKRHSFRHASVPNSELKKHSFRYATEPTFKCSICEKIYATQLGLQLHIQSIHAGLKLTCNLCQKEFGFKNAIADHMRKVHNFSDYVMFQCDFCKRNFNEKKNLARHIINLHFSGINFGVYNRKKIGKRPKKSRKETTCDICNKNFKHPVNLYQHKRNVHTPKVDCDVCHRRYKNKQILAKHMKDKHCS